MGAIAPCARAPAFYTKTVKNLDGYLVILPIDKYDETCYNKYSQGERDKSPLTRFSLLWIHGNEINFQKKILKTP